MNYINNIRNYVQTVKHFYDTYQKSGEVIAQQPDHSPLLSSYTFVKKENSSEKMTMNNLF